MIRYVCGVVILVLLVGLISCNKQEEKKETGNVEAKKEATAEIGEAKLPIGHPPLGGGAEQSIGNGKDTVVGGIGQEKIGDTNISAVGHPPGGEVKRDVRVPDEVKTKWKSVNLKLIDREKKTEEVIAINIGKEVAIKGTNFTIKAEVFLPHYTMYDTYIGSKSNEPVNPAILVELLEGGKSRAKGWVFANFTDFNSFKHARYEILLPPISSTEGRK